MRLRVSSDTGTITRISTSAVDITIFSRGMECSYSTIRVGRHPAVVGWGANRRTPPYSCSRLWLNGTRYGYSSPSVRISEPLGHFAEVGVGIMVAHNPLHGSGRAGFPHPALASGDDAKAAQGIGVTDADRRPPAINQPPHAVPEDPAVLTTSRQRAMPEPARVEPKQVERRSVHGHPVVADVSLDHRAQPLTHLRDRVVHASPEFGGDLTQLSLQPRTNRLPQHRKTSVASLLPADVREAEEVESFGLPLTASRSVLSRAGAELQEPGLLGMQLQSELPNTLGQFLPAALGIRPMLESKHDVIGEPDDNHVAMGLLLTPRPDPQVEHVVEIDVREQWRCAAALRRPFFHPPPLAPLQHARVQPFLDEPNDAPVRNPVLDKLHQPSRGRSNQRTHGRPG